MVCRPFSREVAYTIRCGGRCSAITDRHNWDGYMVNGIEYRLTLEDCISLQGFDDTFEICGTIQQRWKQIGNTIPTIFTELLGKNIAKYCAAEISACVRN
jgi:site-specific DNA-cytosine methylase